MGFLILDKDLNIDLAFLVFFFICSRIRAIFSFLAVVSCLYVCLTSDRQIGESLDIGHATIERVRQRFVEEGIESALSRPEQKKQRSLFNCDHL